MNGFLKLIGFDVEQPEDGYEEMDVAQSKEKESSRLSNWRKKDKDSKVVTIHTTQLKLVVIHPDSFDDAQEIADHLKAKKPVVVNLERVDRDVAKKVIDFLSGAVYALDGNIQKVAAGIFLIAPYNVGIQGDEKEEIYRKVSSPWG